MKQEWYRNASSKTYHAASVAYGWTACGKPIFKRGFSGTFINADGIAPVGKSFCKNCTRILGRKA